LEDLSRIPAETKAAVMQIVEQTKKRSGWRVYRTLAALGVPRSVYYAWKKRDNLEDRTGKPCRVYELLPEERTAICDYALKFPKIGYRKLTWMMVDVMPLSIVIGMCIYGRRVAVIFILREQRLIGPDTALMGYQAKRGRPASGR
jgi:hypothetical protein